MNYVLSDIHGNLPRFESIMKQIHLQPDDTLYILGDVIDRYSGGIKLLKRIMNMPNVKMVLGNHEYMMLSALYYPITPMSKWEKEEALRKHNLELWYRNGGEITHYYLKHYRKDVRQEIFKFLDHLPLNIEVNVNGKEFILAHASIWNDEMSNRMSKRTIEDIVWSRSGCCEYVPEGKFFIFGHTPTSNYQNNNPMTIWQEDDRMDIDCGCGYEHGRLACVRLEDFKEFYSED